MAITNTPLLGLPYAGADTDETYDVLAGLFVKDGQKLTLPEIVDKYTPTIGTVYIKAADWTAADGTADAYDAKITISGVEPNSMILLYPASNLYAEKAKRLGIRAKAASGVANDDTFVIVRATGGDTTVTDGIGLVYIALRGYAVWSAGLTPPALPYATVIGVDPYIATVEGDRDDIAASQRLVTRVAEAIRKSVDVLAKTAIDKTVNDLVNYYNKSQTLTKDEINALVSAIPKFSIEVVTSLPTSNISDTTVYLVKSGDDDTNLYIEYIRTNGKWEKLGTQTVDLTGYATEAWVNDILASYVKTVDMEAYVTGLLAGYLNKEDAAKTYQPAGDYPNTDEMNEAISEATKGLAPKTLIPTKTSQLSNDSGFLTQHQSLAHLLPRFQGTENAGKYMIVGADGYITLVDAPETGDVIGVIGEDRQIALSGDIAKGTYTLLWTDDKGNTYDAGSLTVGEMYTVTANVTNCTVVSNTDRVLEGRPYTATVTPDSGHEITSITVTMGSDDITGEAVSGEEISIDSVTGDVTITAVATEKADTYTILSYAEVGAEKGEVDTGYVATAKTGFAISFAATTTGTMSSTRYNNGFCGNKAFCVGMVTDNARAFKGTLKSFELFKDSDTSDHVVKLNYNGDGACEIDGAKKGWNTGGADPTDFTESLRIFTAGSHGTLSKGALYLKVYEFVITESGSVVRTLKPCKRGKDGNIGFYDTVNGVFYPSTGSVTGGAVVEEISL